ncbi:Type I HSP40 co-chaperone [Nowakowskiella sp. JEL0078]|nr:Type I HSP40 co-chaperone [Nowakowskiella sp. JEL0078]
MGASPEDLFSHLFGGSMFGGAGGKSKGPRKGKDMTHSLKVTLEELYKGKVSKLRLSKQVLCSACEGKGGKEGAVKTCDGCNGRGVKIIMRQMGPMIQQMQQTCPTCNGEGEIIDAKNRCKVCLGKKVTSDMKVLEVHIDKGMVENQKITFSGEGDQAPGVIPGDIIIVVEVKEHSRFKRKGDDLFYEAKIDLLTALAGGQFIIQHLDDRNLLVSLLPGEVIKPGDSKCIVNEGMPIYRRPFDKGNLYIKFEIIFPQNHWTNYNKIQALESILPPRTPLPNTQGLEVEEVNMQEIDPNRQRRSQQINEDEDENQSGPNVKCAQQ